jgi:hypothetical protein
MDKRDEHNEANLHRQLMKILFVYKSEILRTNHVPQQRTSKQVNIDEDTVYFTCN